MQAVDRLGWAAGLTLDAFGVRLGVRVNDASVLPRLVSHLPPGWKPAPSPYPREIFSLFVGGPGPRPGVRRFHLAYQGPTRLERTHDLDEAIEALESDLRLYVALWAKRRIFVHAGVVEWRGRAIVLPGPSYCGKSTLVAALVRAGARYYSDEYAVLDARGRVHPYPAPLRVRAPQPGARTRPAAHPPEGTKPGDAALPVALAVFSLYERNGRWCPRIMTPGQGALAMLENTVPARFRPAESMAAIGRALSNAPAFRGVRGEADETAHAILNSLEAAAPLNSRERRAA